jgi:hypothetical protein
MEVINLLLLRDLRKIFLLLLIGLLELGFDSPGGGEGSELGLLSRLDHLV